MPASDWEPLLAELQRRRAAATAMGGPDRVARQRAAGRLTARERVDALFDPGTFVEIGALVGGDDIPSDALVAGAGYVDGRMVLAGAEDFTVLGGSIGAGAADKRYRLCQLAVEQRLPIVMMLEGAGHRLTDNAAGRRPNDLQGLADASGAVPLVALVMGASAGHGALTAPLCDFVVMTEQASLFSAGPPLVKAAVGEDVTKDELGGPRVHVDVSGVAHNAVADDAAAIALARRYLSYFPSHAWERPPWCETGDTGRRDLDGLLDLIPPDARKPYSMRAVVDTVFDARTVLEVHPRFGAAIVCALARLGGHAVAVVANDPGVKAGTIDSAAADKAAHFIDVAGAFHLPVVFLADNPGVMAGTRAERDGALRHVARMFMAQHRLSTPKLHVTVRKAFGFGSSVMAMNPFDRQTVSLALPSVTLAAMPDAEHRGPAGANEAGPYRAAKALAYDDVIDPRQLRNALLDGLRIATTGSSAPVARVTVPGITP